MYVYCKEYMLRETWRGMCDVTESSKDKPSLSGIRGWNPPGSSVTINFTQYHCGSILNELFLKKKKKKIAK